MIALPTDPHRVARRRRIAAHLASVLIGTVAFLALVSPGSRVEAVASSGTLTLRDGSANVITSGGSGTAFTPAPPSGAACPGSASSTPAYNWQTFFVGANVDPSAVTYGASGAIAIPGSFVFPMYKPSLAPVLSQNPASDPIGLITAVPQMSFARFNTNPASVRPITAGDYIIGIACSLADTGATVSYWATGITITAAAGDTPGGFTWAVASVAATTTTTTTTTAAATSTTAHSGTTTTVTPTTVRATATSVGATSTTTTITTTSSCPTATTNSATTSTIAGSTSTSTTVPCATTTTVATNSSTAFAQSGAGASGSNSSLSLANAGTSSGKLIWWALLLLVVGRMVVLIARPIRARPPR